MIKATGTSEAEIIALKGAAEAEAMRKKADSFKEYNQAAVLQILVAALPEIAKAIAEPLSKTDKITIVSTGGDGTGASKLTGDIAKIMAELPAVVESLSGVDIRRLIDSIPALKEAVAQGQGRSWQQGVALPARGKTPSVDWSAQLRARPRRSSGDYGLCSAVVAPGPRRASSALAK